MRRIAAPPQPSLLAQPTVHVQEPPAATSSTPVVQQKLAPRLQRRCVLLIIVVCLSIVVILLLQVLRRSLIRRSAAPPPRARSLHGDGWLSDWWCMARCAAAVICGAFLQQQFSTRRYYSLVRVTVVTRQAQHARAPPATPPVAA